MGGAADTPMMRQFLRIKADAQDALLLYRMGDFYEMFFDDARVAAEVLELTLTSRNKNDPDPIPMAGVPYHALETYLRRLVSAGHKVAIAEQKEPAGGGKRPKLMERHIVRVVTPGVPWDPDALEARQSCFLAAICARSARDAVGLAFLDVTTGDLRITEVADMAAARAELERMEARELVAIDRTLGHPVLAGLAAAPSVVDEAWFDAAAAFQTLCQQLKVVDLLGFGVSGHGPGVAAGGAVLSYARQTARIGLDHVRRLEAYTVGGHMVLDEATRRNLELLRPIRGTGRKGTLLGLLDRTRTPMGGRMLREWIVRPLTHRPTLAERHDAVDALLDPHLRGPLRDALVSVADLERLASKVAQETANARDLVALATSLRALPGVARLIRDEPALTARVPEDTVDDAASDIHFWLVDEPPSATTEGGIIRAGVHPELDELVTLSREGKGAMARMESRERQRTGISSLRVKHNRVFGYFLEVTQANLHLVPDNWIRKQTLSNCERYITAELKEFEERVLGADERRKQLEYQLFRDLRARVSEHVQRIQTCARAVAWLDVVGTFAELAEDRRYVRPELVDDPDVLDIRGGRHPVVEAMDLETPFVPNDLVLDPGAHLVILTGPNMAGKSTVMRQAALIALLAQIGAFVPADSARLGVCDRLFVRVGASDDLARGRSTFMVEMSETAHILNGATRSSLVLLDEIGRGTSTYDGLAIAWAVAEAVADRVGARTIFATHYHELVSLSQERTTVTNRHVAVSEHGDRIIFLHALRQGGASRSYGIQCARIAGMPQPVVERAQELLAELEKRPRYGPPTRQMSLFGAPAPAPKPAENSPIIDILDEAEPDDMTPRQAHALLYKLKKLARKERSR